ELVLLDEHLARLTRGCATLGLPAPDLAEARRLCEEAAASVPGRAAVRLTLTAGSGGRGLDRPSAPAPRLFATAAAAPAPAAPATLFTATIRRNETSPASRLKTLSYLDSVLARAEATAVGADEALMLNHAGEVACAAAANIFWVEGSRLCTPTLECGVLDGVIRARVLEAAPRLGLDPREIPARPGQLVAADEVFLTNSLIGLRPVIAIDGNTLAAGARITSICEHLRSLVS
ncbi:MAG TPA: aminotransferase class IV, partial [Caulobacteraceae bacterium]|nr:aminotransferase class IV [Caulobacteraceae bacterium]